jgi:hypothetical protein
MVEILHIEPVFPGLVTGFGTLFRFNSLLRYSSPLPFVSFTLSANRTFFIFFPCFFVSSEDRQERRMGRRVWSRTLGFWWFPWNWRAMARNRAVLEQTMAVAITTVPLEQLNIEDTCVKFPYRRVWWYQERKILKKTNGTIKKNRAVIDDWLWRETCVCVFFFVF